jgi:hypothetical protein
VVRPQLEARCDRTALIVFLGIHRWVLHPPMSVVRCPVLRFLSVDVSLS